MTDTESKFVRGDPHVLARVARVRWRWGGAFLVLGGITAVAVYRGLVVVTPPDTDQPDRPSGAAELESSPAPRARTVLDDSPMARLRAEALAIAEQLTADLPDSPHALCLLATVRRRYANRQAATRALRQALALDPRCADAHQSLGTMALEQGDYEAAAQHLREAQRIDPQWDEVPLPLAEALLHEGQFDAAAQVLESYLQRRPHSADAWLLLGQVYQQSGDFENSRRCNQAAVDADPNCVKAYYGLGMALLKLGDTNAAKQQLEHFRQQKSRELAEIKAERARLQDQDIARKTLTNTCVTAGEIYANHNRLDAGERCWKRAAMLDAKDIASRDRLCSFMVRQQRFDEAQRWADSICELDPNTPENWLRLGNICVQAGHPEQAETPFRRVIALAPDAADGHAALAQVLMLPSKDNRQAVALARKAVQLQPTADHYFVLAAACWTLEDWPQARQALLQAIELNPDDPRYRKAYANLQDKLGR